LFLFELLPQSLFFSLSNILLAIEFLVLLVFCGFGAVNVFPVTVNISGNNNFFMGYPHFY
jgi:hypothetical protein